MLKRVAAAAALSLVPTVMVAAPSQAAYSCSISVPSKVSVTSTYRAITAKFSAGCLGYTESAWWDIMHPTQGWEGAFNFDGASSDVEDWYDWSPLGTYTIRPDFAYDYNYNDVHQNTRTMTVRLGSRTAASSSRSGRYVTVRATATRYSPSAGTYRAWSGAKVSLRQKSCSSCSWKWVRSGTTDRYGRVSLKAYASTTRYWQIATVDTSNTWGKASTTLKR
ncbi:hypothetical protein [Janibacter sp. LM]|uniref:hypothetical protein n=1 Tax=Janibacter sp. LM TaxID=3144845 RepID=UPI0031F66550